MGSHEFGSEFATEADIEACFRLLLGRAPSPEERAGHGALAGSDLRAVVRSYLGSQEFRTRGLLGPTGAADLTLVREDGFVLYVSRDDLAVGALVAARRFERGVARTCRGILRPGMTVLDIGANVGFYTMLAASIVGAHGAVLAVEPNADNVRLIEASRRENAFGNVTVAACATGRTLGLLSLTTAFSNGSTARLGATLDDIMTSAVVPSVPLASLVDRNRRIDFVKIDVEGAEHDVLAGGAEIVRRWRPVIVSEFSPSLLQANSGVTGREYLDAMIAQGYRASIIGPDGECRPAGPAEIVEHQATCGSDHIDVLFRPARARRPTWRERLRRASTRA